MSFEDWLRSQSEYEHLLRKYGEMVFIKHQGDYQRFEVRLAHKAYFKDRSKESNNLDWIEEYARS